MKRTKGEWDRETGKCPCNCFDQSQHHWFALCEKLGSEEAARKHVAMNLRYAAVLIEKGGFPDIFGCDVPVGTPFSDTFIETFSVTLSQPWPG